MAHVPPGMVELSFNPYGDIPEQLEDLGLYPKSKNDYKAVYDEIYNNLTSALYIDECGQLWINRVQGLQYLVKCKL